MTTYLHGYACMYECMYICTYVCSYIFTDVLKAYNVATIRTYVPSSLSWHFTIMYHTIILMPNVKTPRIICFSKEFIGSSKKSDMHTNKLVITLTCRVYSIEFAKEYKIMSRQTIQLFTFFNIRTITITLYVHEFLSVCPHL